MKNVTVFGISPSENTPCGAALNALLTEHPQLHFPAGIYLIEETLKLPSNCHLKLDEGAVIRLADGAAGSEKDYLLCNADPDNGNEDITLEGGCFDGNQNGNPRPAVVFTDDPNGVFVKGYTGAMMHFENVKGIKILNLTMTNAEAYYSRFTHVHGFHIENIFFDSVNVRWNNDGIHIGGNCSGGVIRNLRATTPGVCGDDMVALNADDALERNEVRGMTNGPISDIVIEDVVAASCHTFVRLLSVFSPIRNIKINGLRGGCIVSAINGDGARHCRVPVFDHHNPPNPDGVGLLENIAIQDLQVFKCRAGNTQGLIDIQERMRNFSVSGFKRQVKEDHSPEAPSLRLKYIQVNEGKVDDMILKDLDTLSEQEPLEISPVEIESLRLDTSVLGA